MHTGITKDLKIILKYGFIIFGTCAYTAAMEMQNKFNFIELNLLAFFTFNVQTNTTVINAFKAL